MGSEDSFSSGENHKLCANGCGFFGTSANMNLCSKCYRDFKIKEEKESKAKAKAAIDKSLNPQQQPKVFEDSLTSALSNLALSPTPNPSSNEVSVKTVKNRCLCCNKRVGLIGFSCRCGSTLCSTHRYPKMHQCTFDFKQMGRQAIAKANPLVKADKVVRI